MEMQEKKALRELKHKTGREDLTEEDLQALNDGKKGKLEALHEQVDHSKMDYKAFEKDLYREHPSVAQMTEEQVLEFIMLFYFMNV